MSIFNHYHFFLFFSTLHTWSTSPRAKLRVPALVKPYSLRDTACSQGDEPSLAPDLDRSQSSISIKSEKRKKVAEGCEGDNSLAENDGGCDFGDESKDEKKVQKTKIKREEEEHELKRAGNSKREKDEDSLFKWWWWRWIENKKSHWRRQKKKRLEIKNQTLSLPPDTVGVYLPNSVFTHGQLYVAISSCFNPKKNSICSSLIRHPF